MGKTLSKDKRKNHKYTERQIAQKTKILEQWAANKTPPNDEEEQLQFKKKANKKLRKENGDD